MKILAIENDVYAENILPVFCNFDTLHTWNIVSGSGVVTNWIDNKFAGDASLKITKALYNTSNTLVFNSGSTEMNTEAPETGLYILSFYVFIPETYVNQSIPFKVKLFKHAVAFQDLAVNFSATNGLQFGKWQRVVQQFALNRGEVLSFEFEVGFDLSSSFSSVEFFVDGFSLILNNKGLTFPPLYLPAI